MKAATFGHTPNQTNFGRITRFIICPARAQANRTPCKLLKTDMTAHFYTLGNTDMDLHHPDTL